MKPRVWVSNIEFSDGTSIELDKNDVIVVVGPNNSGKSATLRYIQESQANNTPSAVVTKVTLAYIGNSEDVVEWFESFAYKEISDINNPIYQTHGIGVIKHTIPHYWGSEKLGGMARIFFNFLSADERLKAANPQQSIALLQQPPQHPIHYIYADDQLEYKISDYFKQAFGLDLILNRNAGSQLPLHVGIRPIPNPGEDRLSRSYAKVVQDLPLLHEQGDGMRSFAGILLFTLFSHQNIILIDEPEAFLHPPQAKELGKLLAKDSDGTRQLFLATHDCNVLRGMLDSGSNKVRVIRITRDGNINKVKQLDSNKISKLWNDPLLRYSNILDGLFHKRVIVCESDSDARFYSALTDSIIENDADFSQNIDAMFTHCGGKDRIPVIVRALREVNTPVAVIVDFDVLNNEHPLRDIFEAAGGDWEDICQHWAQVKNAIDSKKPELNSDEVIHEISSVLSAISEQMFPKTAKESIKKILRRSSPWAIAKTVGKSFIPHGEAYSAYNNLIDKLIGSNIYIVQEGELECFVPSVGNHGPRWVNEVLNKNLATDPELLLARQFVSTILKQHTL